MSTNEIESIQDAIRTLDAKVRHLRQQAKGIEAAIARLAAERALYAEQLYHAQSSTATKTL